MLYIYGAGAYGIHCYYVLKQYGCTIHGFIDQDIKKIGYFVNGLSCYSLREIESSKKKKEICIIVCVKKNSEMIVRDIHEIGIEKVYTMYGYQQKYLHNEKMIKKKSLQDNLSLGKAYQSFCESFYSGKIDDDLDDDLSHICVDAYMRNIR